MKRVRPGRSQRGQAVVELSLVITVLLLLVLGLLAFGQIMHAYLSLTYASREGARAAALQHSDADVRSAVASALPPTIPQDEVTTTISPTEGERPRGTPVTVELRYRIPIAIPLLAQAIGRQEIVLVGRTTMRAE
ncbi:MAG: TadE/TadG family type IV pilus assembly protein [Chitinophagales bacterium]